MTQAFLISRFKQAGTEMPMDFNAGSDYGVCNFITSPRFRVSAVNI
jgi:hypothetical protein